MNNLQKLGVFALALIGVLVVGASMMSAPVTAKNVAQSVEMVKTDVQSLSNGYRASKITGNKVVNDADESIGKIDDIIVSSDDNKSAYVILSVGGWLGMGTHFVALPYRGLRILSNKIVLSGATKEWLKGLPEFKYNVT